MDVTTLPLELQFNYLLDLPYADIMKYCSVSRTTAEICRDPYFWERKANQDFGVSPAIFREIQLEPTSYRPESDPRNRYLVLLEIFATGCRTVGELNDCLAKASYSGSPTLIDEFIRRGANKYMPAFRAAAAGGHTAVLDALLSNPQLRERIDEGYRYLNEALSVAATVGHLNVVEYLIQHGATNLGTALVEAYLNHHDAIVQFILQQPNQQNTINGALIVSVHNKKLEGVRFALNLGATDQNIALGEAATIANNLPMLEALVQAGVTPEALNRALRRAAIYRHLSNVKFLVDVGATVTNDLVNNIGTRDNRYWEIYQYLRSVQSNQAASQ